MSFAMMLRRAPATVLRKNLGCASSVRNVHIEKRLEELGITLPEVRLNFPVFLILFFCACFYVHPSAQDGVGLLPGFAAEGKLRSREAHGQHLVHRWSPSRSG